MPQLTYRSRCEVGGRSQPVGPFYIYELPSVADAFMAGPPIGRPAPEGARCVAAYFNHTIDITNTGDTRVQGEVTIFLGRRDGGYERSDDQEEIVGPAVQFKEEPGGPRLTLTPVQNETYRSLPPRALSGHLDLHPAETVSVAFTTVARASTTRLLFLTPDSAAVRMRGVEVVEEQSPTVPRSVLETTTRGLKRRTLIAVGSAAVVGIVIGRFWDPLVEVPFRLASRSRPVWAVVGVLSYLASISASGVATFLLAQGGTQELRRRRFWVLVASGLGASLLTAYLSH